MQLARWALVGTVILAAFQAWLWAMQDSLVGLAVAIGLVVIIAIVLMRPGSRFSGTLNRAWALPRAPGESERRYRFKVAIAWVCVVVACVLACIAVRGTRASDAAGIALRIFGFVAALMALQSFLLGLFRSANNPPVEKSQVP